MHRLRKACWLAVLLTAAPVVAEPSNKALALGPACAPDAQTLCLHGARYKVTANWATANDSGSGAAKQLTNDSGSFTFFGPNNVELVVKVLDGCGVNHRYWVFAAGLTNVRVDLYVTDTTTSQSKHYINPLNLVYPPLQDTGALAVCP